MIECLRETLVENQNRLMDIEAIMVRKARNNEPYRKELDKALVLKSMIAQAIERLHQEINNLR
jgi:predicted  nucleic acid-binding Zn-ribbon protein